MSTETERSSFTKLAADMPDRLKQLVTETRWEKRTVTKMDWYTIHTSEDTSWRKSGTIYITGVLKASPEEVLNALVTEVHLLPKWNPRVQACRIVEKIDSSIDLIHQVTKGVRGFIAQREFIILRKLETTSTELPRSWTFAMESTTLPEFPITTEVVRGEYHLGGWLLSDGDEEGLTNFQWVVNVDPKLALLPYKLVEGRLLSTMAQTIEGLQAFLIKN